MWAAQDHERATRPERGDDVVRRRQDGRNLKRRFKTERDAVEFERNVMAARPQRGSGLSSVEARPAELEARFAAGEPVDVGVLRLPRCGSGGVVPPRSRPISRLRLGAADVRGREVRAWLPSA